MFFLDRELSKLGHSWIMPCDRPSKNKTEGEAEEMLNNFSTIISNIEHIPLSQHIKALGGTLRIIAHFQDEEITIN
jgi:hypothetical protein